jgi:2-C-methyl-D-erythritol 4-phosphate cytidylyltransferase
MILRTLDRCFEARGIDDLILVISENEFTRCENLLNADRNLQSRSWRLQRGGATRQESVKQGLEQLKPQVDLVVVHDGARPLVSAALIDRCIELAREKGAVVAGVPVRDTIKIVSEDRWIQSTPKRSDLWEIQTPQVFRKTLILEAHEWATQSRLQATDDAMLVEQMGKPVFVEDGERSNFKITVPEDILIAEALIRDGRGAKF